LPPPSRIPDQLCEPLSGLADNFAKAETVAMAAKKLNPDDTQTLVDALDLVSLCLLCLPQKMFLPVRIQVLEENPPSVPYDNPVMNLVNTLMASTHIYPQRYKLHRIRYDPSPIAEDSFGKVYKGRDLDVCVNMMTNSSDVAVCIVEYML
jgi:hypothetical protein